MDSIDAEDLYAEIGEVPWSRPLMQGDVFRDIIVPGLGEEPRAVQVVMHPCAMRKGAVLLDRLTVAAVEPYHERINAVVWAKHTRVMPLPGLIEGEDRDYATKFVEISAAPSTALTLDRRLAALTDPGILILQQRLIVHSTRYAEVDLDALRKVSSPVFAESELQNDWVEAAIDASGQDDQVVEEAIGEFQAWLDEGSPSRRERLQNEANHSALRRETRAEVARRYSEGRLP